MANEKPHDGLHEGAEPPPPGVQTAAKVRWVIIALATLIAIASLGSWVVGSLRDRLGTAERVAAGEELWQCPMHPAIVSDGPGTCPICGMDLVKVEISSAAMTVSSGGVPGLATVDLTLEKRQRGGVRTVLAERRAVPGGIRTIAVVAADESRLARVQTRFSGWIEKLHVAETGQKVAKGQVLAEIFSRELFTAQQEYVNALRWARGDDPAADALAKQARQRLELLGIAGPEIEALEKSGEPIRALPIRSPVSGYVTAKGAVEGIFVDPGTSLFDIADLSRVWALAEVYERDLASVRVGQRAVLTVAALPGESFEGTVAFLPPTVDPQSRTLRARVELPNPKLLLRPGMYGDVSIASETREGILIPREAIVDTGKSQYVFVEIEPGRFQPRLVRTSPATDTEVLVQAGLEAGEAVVTSGNFLLDSESRLRAASQAAGRKRSAP